MNPLRDAQLAHSYADEIMERSGCPDWCDTVQLHHHVEPTRVTRRDVVEIVVGVPVMLVLFIGLPVLIWLVAS